MSTKTEELITRTRKLLAAADAGPWQVCPMEVYIMCDEGMVADSWTRHEDDDVPPSAVARIRGAGREAPQEDNLRLIAAAPELLAALADALAATTAGGTR